MRIGKRNLLAAICIILPVMFGCGETGSPRSTIQNNELIVRVVREKADCNLRIIATNADNGAPTSDGLAFENREKDSFNFSTDKVESGVRAIMLWAICADDRDRIVEMGNTIVGVPINTTTIELRTKRLQNTPGSNWFKMNTINDRIDPSMVQQNAILSYKKNAAIITGNNSYLLAWNGYGWTRIHNEQLSCFDLVGATFDAANISSPLIRAAIRPVLPKGALCQGSTAQALSFGFEKQEISSRPGSSKFTNWSSAATSYAIDQTGYAKTLIISATSNVQSSVYQATSMSGEISAYFTYISRKADGSSTSAATINTIAASPTIDQASRQSPLALITERDSEQYFWRIIAAEATAVDLVHKSLPAVNEKLDSELIWALSVASFRSKTTEGYWVIGRSGSKSPNLPIFTYSPASGPTPATLVQSEFLADPSSGTTTQLNYAKLNCRSIYSMDTDTSAQSRALVACDHEGDEPWIFDCSSTSSTKSVCKGEKLDRQGSQAGEFMISIHGSQLSGKSRVWAIGNKGSIWLYQD